MSQLTVQPVDDLRTRKVELVLQQLDSLPTLPGIVVRLLNLTGSPDAKITEVAKLIGADPALTSKVLSLVQSAAAGIRQPVTTVHQAIVMLGFETIRNLVLSVKVFEVFQHDETPSEASRFARGEFWKHSLAVATAAEMLATRAKVKLSSHDAFVCGLLHDLGKVAFDTVMPKSFDRVVEVATMTRGDIADAERRIIGLDHSVAGKRLAEAWNLPPIIIQTLWLHHSSPTSVPAGIGNPGMVQLIGLADLLTRRQHIGFSGNYLYPFDVKEYLPPLGLTEGDVAAVTESLADHLEERAQAIGLYDVESRTIYLQSIANANAELGRVNQALAGQNRKLALRSQCFDMLTQFALRIAPVASPAQLLTEIGHVAHGFLGADRIVLFSQDPDQNVGEVLSYDSMATTHDSFLMAMPKHGGDLRAGRPDASFLRPASPQLDWLLERIQAFIGDNQRCWFMPLLSGTEPVGGMIWPVRESATQVQAAGADLVLVSQSWGRTLRMAQVKEQQNVLTEALSASNRELAALQQQLIRAKSLASLGEMAAGAAHEMNNPLAVVCGRAQLLASKLSDVAHKQEASLIAQQGERLSQIITDLMEFAKPHPPVPAECSLIDLVREAADDAKARCGQDAPLIRLDADVEIPSMNIDARLVRGAVSEIILNAIQATANGSSLDTGPREILLQIRFDALDDQAIVQVTDRGSGMSEETMRQAFSPFFSAKAAGRQRGMGLAKAMRWIEAHGGTIRLDSVLNAGTTVVLILPRQAGAESSQG